MRLRKATSRPAYAAFPPWPAARLSCAILPPLRQTIPFHCRARAGRNDFRAPVRSILPRKSSNTHCEDDIIPDAVPTYGHLDDALLLELAWPVLAEDVDDYRDFCHFRDEATDSGGRPVHQLDWLRARAEEGALWEHMHRVHDQVYVEHVPPVRFFRVS